MEKLYGNEITKMQPEKCRRIRCLLGVQRKAKIEELMLVWDGLIIIKYHYYKDSLHFNNPLIKWMTTG